MRAPLATTDTSKRGLERLICAALARYACDLSTAGQVTEPQAGYGGDVWCCGSPHDYDHELCVDRVRLDVFLLVAQLEGAGTGD